MMSFQDRQHEQDLSVDTDPISFAGISPEPDVLTENDNLFNFNVDILSMAGPGDEKSAWDMATPDSALTAGPGFDTSPAPTTSTGVSSDIFSPIFSPGDSTISNISGLSGFCGMNDPSLVIPDLSHLSPSDMADISAFSTMGDHNSLLSTLPWNLDQFQTPIDMSIGASALQSCTSPALVGLATPDKTPGKESERSSSPKSKEQSPTPAPLSAHVPKQQPATLKKDVKAPAKEPVSKSKKRKLTENDDNDEDDDDMDDDETADVDGDVDMMGKGKPKKTAHNVIEKRYRTNLNQKFAILRDSVPSLRVMTRDRRDRTDGAGKSGRGDPDDLDGLAPAHKLNKATVLSKAVEYIVHLEKRNKRMSEEIKSMRRRLDEFERMPVSMPIPGMMGVDTFPEWSPGQGNHPEDDDVPVFSPSMGMIPMTEEMQRMRQRRRAKPAPPSASDESKKGRPQSQANLTSRVILGALAGLVVLEGGGGSSSDGQNSQGMGAFPWLERFAYSRLGASTADVLRLVRLALAFAALTALVLPFLSSVLGWRKRAGSGDKVLVKDRIVSSTAKHHQKAFLAAAQTLRFPAPGAMPETLSILSEIGNAFVGRQSFSRRKTWDMAVNSQLMGGDLAISTGRLWLSIVGAVSGSGSIVSSAKYTRYLMRLALQIRITSVGSADQIGHIVASWLWRRAQAAAQSEFEARSDADAGSASGHDSGTESTDGVTGHVTALLRLDPDAVFSSVVVSRAVRMVWSNGLDGMRPDLSARLGAVARTEAGMGVSMWLDEAIDDDAVISPLDLLAAWVAAIELHVALMAFLSVATGLSAVDGFVSGSDPGTPSTEDPSDPIDPNLAPSQSSGLVSLTSSRSPVDEDAILASLDTALAIAPRGSAIHLRVLAAKGVLDSDGVDSLRQLRTILTAQTGSRIGRDGNKTPADVHFGLELGECIVDADARPAVAGENPDDAPDTPVSPTLSPADFISDTTDAFSTTSSSSSSSSPASSSASVVSTRSSSASSSSSSRPSRHYPTTPLGQRLSSLAIVFSSPSKTPTHSLLSLAVAHTALHSLSADQPVRSECQAGLERLASGIRDLVGRHAVGHSLTQPGRARLALPSAAAAITSSASASAPGLVGLSDPLRARLVDDCLEVTRTLVGLAGSRD